MMERITIFAIGDKADHDSYRKLHREKDFILRSNFDYVNADYEKFLTVGAPLIKTEKVIIFLFFPFKYWNKSIEHKDYKGIYGSRVFFNKFSRFWKSVNKAINKSLKGKDVFFVNAPELCGLYRDKMEVSKKFLRAGIPNPKIYGISRVKDADKLLEKGENLFLKPRYGSMGKGITFLSWENWQTNLDFKNGKIKSRRSDHGWKFRNITGNRKFLSQLLSKGVMVEKAIDPLVFKQMKVDMRIYSFFNKVVYIYPRKNSADKITTNISQGARGDPGILQKLPKASVERVRAMASDASRALGLNFVGLDVMIDRSLKNMYVLDANVFPGFPKRKTFNLAREIITELAGLAKRGKLHFGKLEVR